MLGNHFSVGWLPCTLWMGEQKVTKKQRQKGANLPSDTQ